VQEFEKKLCQEPEGAESAKVLFPARENTMVFNSIFPLLSHMEPRVAEAPCIFCPLYQTLGIPCDNFYRSSPYKRLIGTVPILGDTEGENQIKYLATRILKELDKVS
jgi:hypothetical protein